MQLCRFFTLLLEKHVSDWSVVELMLRLLSWNQRYSLIFTNHFADLIHSCFVQMQLAAYRVLVIDCSENVDQISY